MKKLLSLSVKVSVVALVAATMLFCPGCCIWERYKAKRIESDVVYRNSLGIYRVGDYYEANGMKGVVFEIDSTGMHGKIVSLNEAECVWDVNARVVWPQNSWYAAKTGALSETEGRDNWRAVTAVDGWYEKYPAFAFCADQGEGWYLPAYYELQSITNDEERLNATLAMHNGTILSHGARYWTSQDSPGGGAAWVKVMNYDSGGSENSKTAIHKVRPIAAF